MAKLFPLLSYLHEDLQPGVLNYMLPSLLSSESHSPGPSPSLDLLVASQDSQPLS